MARSSFKWFAFEDEPLDDEGPPPVDRVTNPEFQPQRMEPVVPNESKDTPETNSSYCMRATLLTLFVIVIALAFLMISIAIAFWNEEKTISSPVVVISEPESPCSEGSIWQQRYCQIVLDLSAFSIVFRTNPNLAEICFYPLEPDASDSDPATRVGNVVEKILWDKVLEESVWKSGNRSARANSFYESLLSSGEQIFPFTTNFYLEYPNPQPENETKTPFSLQIPPQFRFSDFGTTQFQRRLNFISLCENLYTVNSASGTAGLTWAYEEVLFENRVIFGSVSTNSASQLDPNLFQAGTEGDRWFTATDATNLGKLGCGVDGCSYFQRASYLPDSLELFTQAPYPERDYRTSYETLCEIGVNLILNTAFPTLLGAYTERAEGAQRAWCEISDVMNHVSSVCGYNPYDLLSRRWPVLPDFKVDEADETTITVSEMIDSIKC